MTRSLLIVALVALCALGCVAAPGESADLVATEVAMRVVVDATLTAVAPPPDEIAFESWRDGNWEIYLMRADGTRQRNLTKHPAADTYPAWSPDGQTLAFSSDREVAGGLYAMAADGSGTVLLRAFDAPIEEIVWSPDGTHLAVTLTEGTPYAVWVIPAEGGQGVRLAEGALRVLEPSWAPDSLRLAVQVSDAGHHRIAVVDRDGGELAVIPCDRAECTLPAWSPDGERIAWVERDRESRLSVAFARPDGSPIPGQESIADLPACTLNWLADGSGLLATVLDGGRCTKALRVDLPSGSRSELGLVAGLADSPGTSPDGRQVAVTGGTPFDAEIYVLSMEGAAPRRLTDNAIPDQRPAWRPRSTALQEGSR